MVTTGWPNPHPRVKGTVSPAGGWHGIRWLLRLASRLPLNRRRTRRFLRYEDKVSTMVVGLTVWRNGQQFDPNHCLPV